MANKLKIIAFSLVSLLAVSLGTGSVFAAYAVTDNADSFNVTIRATMAPRTITFHIPDADDPTCSTYNTTNVQIEYGETLADITVPNHDSFLGFTFAGWYQESTFENSFANNVAVSNDMDLYAKFTRSQNVLYDGNTFYASSNSDQTVDAQYVYKVSSQTWGVVPATSNENKIDLKSSSGIYKMTYSSDWTILRKIGLNAKDCSWWGDDGYVSYVFGTTEDHSSWGNKWWASTISTSGVYVNNSDHKTGEVYIDYSLTYFGVIRCNPSNPPVVDSNSSDNPTNQTSQTSITGYNKNQIYLYWSSDNVVPTWGNGN